ncbi:hypothetical protein [Pseudoroseomonas cervicalis]|uniref:hypothetical protein n=1 Tax=Teichococcus cervicalis TaxID=204525 RepID=UPI00277DC195|nr:hypothetical protein [Pseudoroseomonas cervicalis]MDQ1079720.1 hypothetical protein [Pseudoroseomonas cervicalis]
MSDELIGDPSLLRNFGQVMAALEEGRFNRDITDAFRELIGTLTDNPSGKAKGKLALQIAVSIDNGIVEIAGDFKVTAPKLVRGYSVFWPTPEGNLMRRNPNEPELPLSDVIVPSPRGLA